MRGVRGAGLMPYTVRKGAGSCSGSKPWAVVNVDTGAVVPSGCYATKAEAQKRSDAMNANVTGGARSTRTAIISHLD